MRLNGKVALITGGGSGIGRATADLFAAEGAKLVVCDMNGKNVSETANIIESNGGYVRPVVGDVTDSESSNGMVQTALDLFGSIDILVNCAGVTVRNAVSGGGSPEQIWDRLIEVNLKGTYLMSWHTVPVMEKSGGGSIINISSIMGLVAYPPSRGLGFDPYPASKAAIIQFTKNLAVDCATKNIRVNCICPGYVETSMSQALYDDPDMLKALEQKIPMGRIAKPEEIAKSVLFLASDDSSYVTAVSIIVDGGYTSH